MAALKNAAATRVIKTAGDRSVLQGVSRGTVFDLAKELGIPVSEEDLQPYDLYTADEAFFTSTSPCSIPEARTNASIRSVMLR